MYKCTKCDSVHLKWKWNHATFGSDYDPQNKQGVEIQDCHDEQSEYYGMKYLFVCPTCKMDGCFEEGEIINLLVVLKQEDNTETLHQVHQTLQDAEQMLEEIVPTLQKMLRIEGTETRTHVRNLEKQVDILIQTVERRQINK